MKETALWLSGQEVVEVLERLENGSNAMYQEPRFQAARRDGTRVVIDRRDILLREEVEMVNELASIMRQKQIRAQNARYADIMRYFLKRGVPFAARLQSQITPKMQLELFDDVG